MDENIADFCPEADGPAYVRDTERGRRMTRRAFGVAVGLAAVLSGYKAICCRMTLVGRPVFANGSWDDLRAWDDCQKWSDRTV